MFFMNTGDARDVETEVRMPGVRSGVRAVPFAAGGLLLDVVPVEESLA